MYTGSVNQAQSDLEAIVDKYSTSTVIAMLEEIASAKAQHVRENWQDEPLAKQWDRLAAVLSKSYMRVNKIDRGI